MAKPLPPRPSLGHLAKQAKALRKDHSAGSDEAGERIRTSHPQFAHQTVPAILAGAFSLSDAQLVIAREYGFDSWPKLKHHLETLATDESASQDHVDPPPPENPHISELEAAARRVFKVINEPALLIDVMTERVKCLKDAHAHKRPYAARLIRTGIRSLGNKSDHEILNAKFTIKDARKAVAGCYWFKSWEAVEASGHRNCDPVFEQAIDLLVAGNAEALRRLLDQQPALATARSPYGHEATLLHYVSANGVEDWRQKTPPNIVDLTRMLFDAGAEVDALAKSYGGGDNETTLCLTVSSYHPFAAGVQADLTRALIDAGAEVEGVAGDGMPLAVALTFGYLDTARALADCGASVNSVVTAAGLDDVDRLKSLFDEHGALTPGQQYPDPFGDVVTDERRLKELALLLAAKLGHAEAVGFLLDKGVDVNTLSPHGATALHEAALQGHLAVVKTLVENGADTSIVDGTWNTKPVMWAAHECREDVEVYLLQHTSLNLVEAIELDLPEQTRALWGDTDPNCDCADDLPGFMLRVAVLLGHTEIAKFLISKGADPTLPGHDGRTAHDIAVDRGDEELIEATRLADH